VVDGKEWTVTTYRDAAGRLCAFQGAVGAGRGGTCLDPQTIFERAPVVLYYGSGQDGADLSVWDRMWLWGFASDRVARLDLTLTNCTDLRLSVDAGGIFQHVSPAAELHAGVLPARLMAYDGAGVPIFSERIVPDPAVPPPAPSTQRCG
jgi:hypothetical protein